MADSKINLKDDGIYSLFIKIAIPSSIGTIFQNLYSIVDSIFAEYSGHILNSNHPDYLVQKSNKLRKLELKFSHFFYRFFKYFAPFLIQGSIFFYVKGRG